MGVKEDPKGIFSISLNRETLEQQVSVDNLRVLFSVWEGKCACSVFT